MKKKIQAPEKLFWLDELYDRKHLKNVKLSFSDLEKIGRGRKEIMYYAIIKILVLQNFNSFYGKKLQQKYRDLSKTTLSNNQRDEEFLKYRTNFWNLFDKSIPTDLIKEYVFERWENKNDHFKKILYSLKKKGILKFIKKGTVGANGSCAEIELIETFDEKGFFDLDSKIEWYYLGHATFLNLYNHNQFRKLVNKWEFDFYQTIPAKTVSLKFQSVKTFNYFDLMYLGHEETIRNTLVLYEWWRMKKKIKLSRRWPNNDKNNENKKYFQYFEIVMTFFRRIKQLGTTFQILKNKKWKCIQNQKENNFDIFFSNKTTKPQFQRTWKQFFIKHYKKYEEDDFSLLVLKKY